MEKVKKEKWGRNEHTLKQVYKQEHTCTNKKY